MGFLMALGVISFVGALTISGIRIYFMIDDYRIRKRKESEQKEKL